MSDHAHPADEHSRVVGRATTSSELTNAYEWALADIEKLGYAHAVGVLQVIASLAIARCKYLEERTPEARENRRVRSVLYPRGDVVPFSASKRGGVKRGR